MGMYTQLHLGVTLSKETPTEIINLLRFMLHETDDEKYTQPLPNHELFKHNRWVYMLTCDSYYFNYKTTHLFKFDDIGQHWWFNVTTNLKNYEDEIGLFLDWINQYIEDPMRNCDEMLGYIRYEENALPDIITWDYILSIRKELNKTSSL